MEEEEKIELPIGGEEEMNFENEEEEEMKFEEPTPEIIDLPPEIVELMEKLTFPQIYNTIDCIKPLMFDHDEYYSPLADFIVQNAVKKNQFPLLYSQFVQAYDEPKFSSEVSRHACVELSKYISTTEKSPEILIYSIGASKFIGALINSGILDLRSGRLLLISLLNKSISRNQERALKISEALSDNSGSIISIPNDQERFIKMTESIIDNAGSTFAISIQDETWEKIYSLHPYQIQKTIN